MKDKKQKGKKQIQQDRHLQTPGEANRDKHINFVAEERGEQDPADEERLTQTVNRNPKNVYANKEDRDRHLQSPTEANRDKHINFIAEERGEKDPADEGKGGETIKRSKDTNSNPAYTNSEAPQQEIERDVRGVMAKGAKDDPSAIYNTDNSTLQTKEEKKHDEKVADLAETEIDSSISSEPDHIQKKIHK
jgi:hypothetical protein